MGQYWAGRTWQQPLAIAAPPHCVKLADAVRLPYHYSLCLNDAANSL